MKPNIPTQERRFASHAIEIRAKSDPSESSRTVRGYAAVFGRSSVNLGSSDYQFYEIIEPGAFDEALRGNTVALFNHDSNLILARSKDGAGTLALGVDGTGLWYEFDAPMTRAGDDLLESIKRGDVESSSFAFSVDADGQRWEEAREGDGPRIYTRTITKISRLYDVSPVVSPAYPDATVALRSLTEFRESEKPEPPAPLYDPSSCPRRRQLELISKPAI